MIEYTIIVFAFAILLLGLLYLDSYNYFKSVKRIVNLKNKCWANYLKFGEKNKLIVKIDKLSEYGLPIIKGIKNRRKILIRLINQKNSQIDKTEFIIRFKKVIPNVIWIISYKDEKHFNKNRYFLKLKKRASNSSFIMSSNNINFLKIISVSPEILKNLKKLNYFGNFYTLIITAKTLKFYTTQCISNETKINNILNILFDLIKEIENKIKQHSTLKFVSKTNIENIVNKYTNKALYISLTKKEFKNTTSYYSLFGFGILLILFGIWILITNPNLIGKITSISLIIPIGLMVFILGYIRHHYWKKYKIIV
jgi:hypothetical protein